MRKPASALAASVAPVLLCASLALGAGEGAEPRRTTRNVAVVVHQNVELLDFAGPTEVFESARAGAPGRPAFNVYTVAPTAGIIESNGVKVQPNYTIADCPAPDIIVVPGGHTAVLLDDPSFMSWLRGAAGKAEITMSVCTGAFALAEAGLLDGEHATTHSSGIDNLREDYPNVRVHEKARYIDNGRTLTTAGISAGIDGALHIVGRLHGRDAARETARYMEYEWRPDLRSYARYPEQNPFLDATEAQFAKAMISWHDKDWRLCAAALAQVVEARPENWQAWSMMGRAWLLAREYDKAAAVFEKMTVSDRHRSGALYNIACARALAGRTDDALEALSRAVDAGYKNADATEKDKDLDSIRANPRYKEIVARMK